MRPLRALLFAILPVAFAACQADRVTSPGVAPGFHFTVDALRYAPGQPVAGSLVNDGAEPLPYSFCSGVLERRRLFGGWDEADRFAQPCAAIQRYVDSRGSVRWGYSLRADLSAGTYRLRYFALPSDVSDDWRSSPPFLVAPAPTSPGVPDSMARAYYWGDAATLAVRELQRRGPAAGEAAEVPQALIDSLFNALTSVYRAAGPARDSVAVLYQLHTRPSPQQLVVGVDTATDWARYWKLGSRLTGNAQVDDLMEQYSLWVMPYYSFGGTSNVVLQSVRPMNVAPIAPLFAHIGGVRFAEVNGIAGDGNDITAVPDAAGWTLEYSLGWGDCPAGCIARHWWTFQVTRAGAVTYMGSRGPKVP